MKNKTTFRNLISEPLTLWQKFHQKTKLTVLPKEKRIKLKFNKVAFKGYARLRMIPLPEAHLSSKITYKNVLSLRTSERKLSSDSLTQHEISNLLYYSAGISRRSNTTFPYRFYPSAGHNYPLEIYLLSCNTNVPKGIYHYYVRSHILETLYLFDKIKLGDYFGQKWVENASAIIIITAVFNRTVLSYKDRGYRHILIESGHLGQNIYLTSSALNISCCAIGGFNDDKLNKLLDIDGINESVLYVLAIGKK